jgi:GNAT superfamily N-acetyltransferase
MGNVSEGAPDSAGLKAPLPLGSEHELDSFNSGVDQLDDWLKRQALHNEVDGGSRTFVACAGRRVIGYYSIAAGSVIRGVATNRVRRNMPEPIPVALLGRLAIDQSWQGRGLGADLLRDAVLRMIGVGETIGIRAILVHAISDAAKSFYERHGFRVSPVEPLTLMMTLAEARRMLDGNN